MSEIWDLVRDWLAVLWLLLSALLFVFVAGIFWIALVVFELPGLLLRRVQRGWN